MPRNQESKPRGVKIVHQVPLGPTSTVREETWLEDPDGNRVPLASWRATREGFECTTEGGETFILPPDNKAQWDEMWKMLGKAQYHAMWVFYDEHKDDPEFAHLPRLNEALRPDMDEFK